MCASSTRWNCTHGSSPSSDFASGTFDWMGPVDPSTDPLWRRMVEGELSERDYWAQRAAEVGRAAGKDFDTRSYMNLVFAPPTPEMIRTEATSVVTSALDAGYGVSVLTNDMRAFQGPDWERGRGLPAVGRPCRRLLRHRRLEARSTRLPTRHRHHRRRARPGPVRRRPAAQRRGCERVRPARRLVRHLRTPQEAWRDVASKLGLEP